MQHRDMQAKDDRIRVLEGHRDQWRRIAFRLSDALEKYDEAAARAIFESADLLRQGTDTKGERHGSTE
jgi:hypothetical protein